MANKRVSELNELLFSQIAEDDLLLISDVSAIESKKVTADNFKLYALNAGLLTGSLHGTASYTENSGTASFLLYGGKYNGTAFNAISSSYSFSSSYSAWVLSSSYALTSLSASYALSSSWADRAITASYAFTSSLQLVVSSVFSDYCKTSSYLLYIGGVNNGTASAAISASWVPFAVSSSYLIYSGKPNGTASCAISTSQARSASFLFYDGTTYNGTASYAMRSGIARLADSALTSERLSNPYFYREFPVITSYIVSPKTASFGWVQFTSSNSVAKVSLDAWGDVLVPQTHLENNSGSLKLIMEGVEGVFVLDAATFINYFTGSSIQNTGSIICSFYLKGQFTTFDPLSTGARYSGSVLAYNGITFYTGSRPVKSTIKATTDYFLDE